MENVKIELSNSRPIFDEEEWRVLTMSDEKTEYERLLRILRVRQNALGITNARMSERLGIKESNYKRLIEGKCLMNVLRLISICSNLGLEVDFCFTMKFDE